MSTVTMTKYGIKSMGFTEIPAGTKIEATFNSAIVYNIEGININELTPGSFADVCYQGSEFSFSFGNSVNEISRKLFDDDFVEDEASWQEENKANPPYLIICFKIKEPYFCTSGHWQKDEEKLLTYDCFPNAKQALREMENQIIPPLVSSLTVQLSKIHRPIRFRFVAREVYAKTNKGETLFDVRVEFSASASTSTGVSPQEIKEKIIESIKQYSKFEPKVGSLFYSGLKEKDRFKKFLNLYQSLEIYTHKTFSQIDFEKHVDEVSPSPTRLEKTARQFFIDKQAESKNLTQRFMWCAILKWGNLVDSDVVKFKQIKKCRDALSHGEEIPESTLPVEDLENLLLKIF